MLKELCCLSYKCPAGCKNQARSPSLVGSVRRNLSSYTFRISTMMWSVHEINIDKEVFALTPSKETRNSVFILLLCSCSPSFLSHSNESTSSENVNHNNYQFVTCLAKISRWIWWFIPCKVIQIPESGKFILVAPEILGYGIRNSASEESTFHWMGFIVQYPESGMHRRETQNLRHTTN